VVWDLKKRKKVRELKGHNSTACATTAVRFSPDGQQLASGTSAAAGAVLVHGVREKQLLARLCRLDAANGNTRLHVEGYGGGGGVGQVEWSLLRPGVVGAAYSDGALAVFDLAAAPASGGGSSAGGGAVVAPLAFWPSLHAPPRDKPSDGCSFGALSFSPLNHKFLASAGGDGALAFVDYDTQKVTLSAP
jgi:WD40 repeat protein